MAPAADRNGVVGDSGVKTLEEQLSKLSIQETAGQLLEQLGDVDYSDLLAQPALPPEVLERVVRHLQPGALIGDPVAHVTLVRLSCVSRLMRYWALDALYSIIILPRHVREFRKWYSRAVKAQPAYQFAGYTRALFCSLDDVSALTSFSTGWDHEFLRLLHYCGPTLTHLSLWRAESMALLRDPGQVREGYRFGTSQPVQVWGELGEGEPDAEAQEEVQVDNTAPPEAEHADDLFSKEELDDMPGWLKAEIRMQGTRAREASAEARFDDLNGHAAPTFYGQGANSDYIPTLNLCDALTSILQDEALRKVLIDELQGKAYSAVPNLEQALIRRCLEGPIRKPSNGTSCPDGVATPPQTIAEAPVDAQRQADLGRNFRLTVTRGNQAMWAKLKDRLWDFRQRAEGISEGSWEMLS
ncbi:hypothetical protein NDA16_003511 [Ustilago loliicola]|nr:hypothetical protein NDA16_003511 [Ustilago loliicola]